MLIFVIKITVSLCGIWVAVALRICKFVTLTTLKTRANKNKKNSNRPWPLTVWSGPVLYWRSGKQKNVPCFPMFQLHVGGSIAEVSVNKLDEWLNEVRSGVLEVTVSTVKLSHRYTVVVQTNIEYKDSWRRSLIAKFTETWNVTTLTLFELIMEPQKGHERKKIWRWKRPPKMMYLCEYCEILQRYCEISQNCRS